MNPPRPQVFYEELPDRPFKVVYDTTTFGEQHQDLSTPRRKTRITKERRTRKHPRPERKEKVDGTGIPGSLSDPDGLPTFMDSLFSPGIMDGFGNEDTNLSNTCMYDEVPPSNVDLTYAGFVDAVLSEECSFYQLSQKVFVANGWNPVKNETNVRGSPLMSCKFIDDIL